MLILPYLLLILYPLLFIWQGLDVTDMGFSLSHYQSFFKKTETVWQCPWWLTNLVGGIWHKFFGFLGVIGYKLLRVFLIWGCIYFSHSLLSPYIPELLIGWALFLTVLALTARGTSWFNRNTLTCFLCMAGIWAMMEGLRLPSQGLLIVSGFLLGINIFARLPNLLLSSLGAAIPVHAILNGGTVQIAVTNLFYYSMGLLISFLVVLAIMEFLGHRQMFIEKARQLFIGTKNQSSRYSTNNLLKLFVRDTLIALLLGGGCILTIISVSMFGRMLQPTPWLWWLSIFALAGFTTIAFTKWHGFWWWMVPGTVCLVLT